MIEERTEKRRESSEEREIKGKKGTVSSKPQVTRQEEADRRDTTMEDWKKEFNVYFVDAGKRPPLICFTGPSDKVWILNLSPSAPVPLERWGEVAGEASITPPPPGGRGTGGS